MDSIVSARPHITVQLKEMRIAFAADFAFTADFDWITDVA